MMKLPYGHRSLRFKLVLGSILVEGIMLSFMVWNSVRLTQTFLVRQTEFRIHELRPLLNASLAGPLLQEDLATLHEILEQVVDKEGLRYLRVQDATGRELIRVGERSHEENDPSETDLSSHLGRSDPRVPHLMRMPIRLAGRVVGMLDMEMDTRFLLHALGSMHRQGVGIAVSEILLSILVLGLLGGALTRHLVFLTRATRRMAAGDLSVRVPVLTKDEIGDTALAFNQMAEKVSRHQQRLQEQSEQIRLLMDSTAEAIYGFDLTGNCTLVNAACARILGYNDPSEIIGKNMHELIHYAYPDGRDFPRRECRIYQAFHKGEKVHVEDDLFFRKGGSAFHVEYWCYPMYRKGRLTGCVVTFLDRTEKRRYDEALRRVNRALTVLSECNQAVVHAEEEAALLKMVCEIIVDVGGYACACVGFPDPDRDETIRPVARAGFHKNELEEIRRAWADSKEWDDPAGKVLRDGEPFVCLDIEKDPRMMPLRPVVEQRGVRACISLPLKTNGRVLGVLSLYALEKNAFDANEIHLLSELASDLAFGILTLRTRLEHQRAEQALRVEQERAQKYLDVAGVMLMALDREGKVTLINQRGAEIMGYAESELIGKNWFDFAVPERMRQDAEGTLSRLLSGEDEPGRYYENLIVTRSGAERRVAWRNTVIRDDRGTITGVLSSGEDITDRKALEEQFLQSQKMEAIGRLAGGIAHDMNNLLTAVIGNADLFLSDRQPGDAGYEEIKTIRETGDRASQLVRQLLAFSRKQVLQPLNLNINETLNKMGRMFPRLLGEDIRCRLVLEQDLKQVLVDPVQIEQILLNLMVNAREAMPGGGELVIHTRNVSLDPEYCTLHVDVLPGEYVLLSVSDTGGGVPEDIQARIFEPFFTTKEHGTGLGLSTTYGIVRQLGGHLELDSEEGAGATFKIYLPALEGKPESPSSPSRNGQERLTGGEETILVVEDEKTIRHLALHLLGRLGYTVLSAASGEEALQTAQGYPGTIDLLITDIILPGKTGFDTARELRERLPGLKVLYISGYTDNRLDPEKLREERTGFLGKPFTLFQISDSIRKLLDR